MGDGCQVCRCYRMRVGEVGICPDYPHTLVGPNAVREVGGGGSVLPPSRRPETP